MPFSLYPNQLLNLIPSPFNHLNQFLEVIWKPLHFAVFIDNQKIRENLSPRSKISDHDLE